MGLSSGSGGPDGAEKPAGPGLSGGAKYALWNGCFGVMMRKKEEKHEGATTAMKAFMDRDFLLSSDTARELFHGIAEDLPIIDYHCHIDPGDILRDRRFETITEVWLGGDHYKWRAMRSAGVPEEYITGNADPKEKFRAWAQTLPGLIGNPLYHWTHLELQRYFGIEEPLSGKNADAVYDACCEALARDDLSVRGILRRSRVRLICTTDDPVDPLDVHEALRREEGLGTVVLPAFRPDRALRADKPAFPGYLEKLEEASGVTVSSAEDLREALARRIAFFAEHGCRVADHALDTPVCAFASEAELDAILDRARRGGAVTPSEAEAFQTAMLRFCAGEYARLGWVMQLHFGCIRDNSARMFARLGPDTGYDAINDQGGTAVRLAGFLDLLERDGALPRTILYSLNPADSPVIASVMGCFQTDGGVPGRVQLGSAWWFNDHRRGMEQQLTDLMDLGYLGGFVGMLTDSRCFLSYTRHEYFRRILCDLLGGMVENGEYPADAEALGELVRNIGYGNARRYFRFDEFLKD